MIKNIFIYVSLFALVFTLASWGNKGHHKINNSSGLSFNSEMDQFIPWLELLASHASDADIRKQWDPEEGPKHYIDIDLYDEFIATGAIPQTLDSVIALYGGNFVYGAGILPWATLTTYDSLVSCMQRHEWDKATLFAADLGHYVADGHMPLHLTMNYNGQYTGNNGIHSRYESAMINGYINEFDYSGIQTNEIENVNQYVFNYIYENYVYVDSVIAADDYAKSVSSNTYSSAYKQALWQASKGYTINLFKNASHALSELIYTAWLDAGQPDISPEFISYHSIKTKIITEVAPNPFSNETRIKLDVKDYSSVTIKLMDLSGQILYTDKKGYIPKGTHTYLLSYPDLSSGMYVMAVTCDNTIDYRRIIVNK